MAVSEDIDRDLLWAMDLTDEPYWVPLQNDEPLLNNLLGDEESSKELIDLLIGALGDIGATGSSILDYGNYIQFSDEEFEFAMLIQADNESLLLATFSFEDGWHLMSICNFDTGEYYYKDAQIFSDVGVSAYDPQSMVRSLFLYENYMALSDGNAAGDDAYNAPKREPVSGTEYVLNTNTGKFHYPHCSSVGDILDHNRMDYVGTREEVIAMGYAPCKRCNP